METDGDIAYGEVRSMYMQCARGSEINVHAMCIKCTFYIHSMHIQCTFKVYAGSMFKLELDDVVVWVALAGGG